MVITRGNSAKVPKRCHSPGVSVHVRYTPLTVPTSKALRLFSSVLDSKSMNNNPDGLILALVWVASNKLPVISSKLCPPSVDSQICSSRCYSSDFTLVHPVTETMLESEGETAKLTVLSWEQGPKTYSPFSKINITGWANVCGKG